MRLNSLSCLDDTPQPRQVQQKVTVSKNAAPASVTKQGTKSQPAQAQVSEETKKAPEEVVQVIQPKPTF